MVDYLTTEPHWLVRILAAGFFAVLINYAAKAIKTVATKQYQKLSLPFIHPNGAFKRLGERIHDAGRQHD